MKNIIDFIITVLVYIPIILVIILLSPLIILSDFIENDF